MLPSKLKPIPKVLFRTPCKVIIEDGITEDGEPNKLLDFSGKCVFVDKAKQVMDAEKHIIRIEGQLILDGDIAPSLSALATGIATINGRTYKIYRCYRPHNPDGSVHHTEIEVM